jgi:hypothetical protein
MSETNKFFSSTYQNTKIIENRLQIEFCSCGYLYVAFCVQSCVCILNFRLEPPELEGAIRECDVCGLKHLQSMSFLSRISMTNILIFAISHCSFRFDFFIFR